MTYTVAAAIALVLAVTADLFVLRTRLVTGRLFWVSYAIIVLGQLAVNGVLTARQVVRYDPDAILGPRIVYAPIEDLVFGFALVLTTLALWVRLGTVRRKRRLS